MKFEPSNSKKPFIAFKKQEYSVDLNMEKKKKYELNTAYLFNDEIFIYKGKVKEGKKLKDGCFYLNSNYTNKKDKYIFKKGKYIKINKDNIYFKDLNLENKIRSIIDDTSNFKEVAKEINQEIKEKSKKSRSKDNDFLYYEINDKDNKIVRLIKELVNSSKITMDDLYNKIQDRSKAYNLNYGLRTRHSMKIDIVERWADVLNMNVEVTLVDKED